jgi:hypothetical protein
MSRYVVNMTWSDSPHLTKEQQEELWNSIPVYQRDARSKGIPQLGSGAIYPCLESDITCEPFPIPNYYRRVFGLDVGWNRTAAVWAAWDHDSDVVYFYDEWYRSEGEPAVHAAGIRARGDWIPGVIDPSAKGRSQTDGTKLIEVYTELGLLLAPADNSVEAGIMTVWERLSEGRLKVFSTLQNWLGEFRIYRRDGKGKVVKKGDHLMDASRYLLMSGLQHATTKPNLQQDEHYDSRSADATRSAITGY